MLAFYCAEPASSACTAAGSLRCGGSSNGVLEQLGARRVPVTTGTWYDLRVEVVGGLTRVFLNNELQFSSSAEFGLNPWYGYPVSKDQVGLATYKATADFDDFRAYQP